MKLLQARRLELRIIRNNGLIKKLLSWSMLARNCFKSQSFTLIIKENYQKVKYEIQNLIRKKKRQFYETNLRQKINKPKELWKTLRSMGLPSKAVTASNICLKDKNEIVFNATKNCSSFKIICQVLHITWYLSYLFLPIILLNLKLHCPITIM